MNRQIKFRAKRKDNGEWVSGDLVNSFEGVHISPDDYFKPSNGDHPDLYAADPETVGQYTEMVDYKLSPIYEGDILAMYHDSENNGKLPMENHDTVIYSFGTPFLKKRDIPLYDWIMKHDGACEVIGNIFDNPKLL